MTTMTNRSKLYSPPLDRSVVGLRAGIIDTVADEYRYYSAVRFPGNSWAVCEMYMRRLAVFGYLTTREAVASRNRWAFVDALNANHDIVETYTTTDAGLLYLRKEWKVGLTRRPVRRAHTESTT